MKKYFYLATALIALASCSSEEYTGDLSLKEANDNAPVTFASGVGSLTRADKTGSEAATDLNGQFYVYGIKKEGGTGGDGLNAPTSGNLVYNNYVVKWVNSSNYTSTSNTKGWEYVGLSLSSDEANNVIDNSGASVAQTIKYWDYGAADYTFYAFSALPADITAGNVKVTKTTSVLGDGKTVYDKGYSVTLNGSQNLDKLFFAERVNITASGNTDRTQNNKYGGNVTFRFHNAATKVRVAMYETIPGYSVTIKQFKVSNSYGNPTFPQMEASQNANFAANFVNSPAATAGTLTVTYDKTETATKNYPVTSFSTSSSSMVLALGTNLKASTVLGEDVGAATYDQSTKAYTSVFPKEANEQNLKLKLDYTLKAANTNEVIEVVGATAEIPAKYLKWKPGFAYTYIFKISDNTNGQTGQSVTGLYPITFDAVEVNTDDGMSEYITTVSQPSITTFGVNSSTGKYVSGGNEYVAGSDIYATFMEGSAVKTPTIGTNVNIYTVSTTDATNFPITEASVAESVANPTGNKITATVVNTDATTNFTAAPTKVTTVPGEDGVDITIDALKLTGVKAGTYAIEYKASTVWTGTYDKVYKVIKVVTP